MDYLSTQNSRKKSTGIWVRTRWDCSGRRLLLFLLLLGLAIFLTHCSRPLTHRQEMVANRPQQKVFKVKSDVVKEAVERVLEDKKFILDNRQSNESRIQTEWLEDGGYRSMAVIDIKPLSKGQTQVKVHLQLEEKLTFRNEWEPMDEIGEDTYKLMLSDIELECYRVLYDRY
ncbi:MAG: hypothetical protein LJE87_08905 [Deltaproteobacteria bacterium]|nr:hypothetical protein [Deltaproteobacteria bacterium]